MFDRIENKLPGSPYIAVRVDLKSDSCPLGPRLVIQSNHYDRQFHRYQIVAFLNTATGRTPLMERMISQEVEDYIAEELRDILILRTDERYIYTGPQSSTKELKLIEENGKEVGA